MVQALVVDDSEEMTRSLCRMLEILDVEAVPALSVREAFLHLQHKLPDVIFLDIRMPGFDGFEVLEYLRREPRLENVPVCVISAENQPETLARAEALGAVDYFVKPVSIEDLEVFLKKITL